MRRGRVLAHRLALLGAVAVASACGKSPEAKAKQAATTLRSWQTTAHLVEEEHARGALPGEFASQAARAAERGRAKAEQQLREASSP
jgi:hypothetical protein